ncbi:MAG: 50S ribosomal protein L6 [Anaerolineae bacterium]|nr:50S ribosomal protein L6 [Anaerolineales bacterium]MCQ3973159.1 50S ribosomal protein L6 [Anaerolineae bacterium]
MSRIGRLPVVIPKGVTVDINKNSVVVKGPKGELQRDFPPEIELKQEDGQVVTTRHSDHRTHRSKHGLTRALLNNMVTGVSTGFKRQLYIEGVGYKAAVEGKKLVLNVGYSHNVVFEPPQGVSFEIDKTGRDLTITGIDKEVLGEISARIRRTRPPEPYKGKGIRYAEEKVRRKAGKAGKAK